MKIYISLMRKVLVVLLVTLISGCSGSQNRGERTNRSTEIPLETYISINRSMVEREQEKIKGYIQENDLNMQQTGTGLWYRIIESGHGRDVQKGQIVTLDYQIKLMNGTVCYDSDQHGPKEFLVGQGGVESGLEEGVLLLKEGAKAQMIMPPHLAHGLIGDDDRIPARSIIIYEIEVLELKNK